MKTKIKRHSRSVISVILAISMLVSCMMVGIIATDAAYDNSESVGINYDTSKDKIVIFDSEGNFKEEHYINQSGEIEFTLSEDITDAQWGFNANGGTWFTKGSNSNSQAPLNDENSYYAKTSGTNFSATLAAGNYYVKFEEFYNDNPQTLKYKFYKKETNYYIHYGTSDNQSDDWSDTGYLIDDTTGYDFTLSANNTISFGINTSSTSKDNTVAVSLSYSPSSSFNYAQTTTLNSRNAVRFKANVAGTYNVKFDGTMVTITGPDGGSTGTNDWHLRGGGYEWNNKQNGSEFTYNSNTGFYEKIVTWSGDNWFKPCDGTITYSGDSSTSSDFEIVSKEQFTTLVNNSSKSFKFSAGSSPTEYLIQIKEEGSTYSMRILPNAKSTLSVADIANAEVVAYYDGNNIAEGGSLANIPAGAAITVSVTPDLIGKKPKTLTTSPQVSADLSGRTFTFTMPAENTSITNVTLDDVTTKKVYFNNYYTRYSMVHAYAWYGSADQSTIDGEPLGAWTGRTMTRIANTNTWEIDVPEDCPYIIFVGDNGYNTKNADVTHITIPWNATPEKPPKYTAGKNPENPSSGGSWGDYVARSNETTVSNGQTLANNSNLFTGLTATMYDYYVDGEAANGNWIGGIGSDEYSNGGSYKWNPYVELNHALSVYANENNFNVWRPLYFGNLNTKNGGEGLSKDTYNGGTSVYTGWNLDANNSINLDPNSTAITGLSGSSLAGSNIHYAKSDGSNGPVMAMFDEDFLSGENVLDKELARILRVSSFPVRKESISSKPTEVYLDTSSFTNWEKDGAVMRAVFFNDNTSDSTRTIVTATKVADHFYKVTIPSGYSKVQWWRADPSNLNYAWNYGNQVSIPTDENCVSKITGWNNLETWGTDNRITPLTTHDYYEFDSENGKDNAYITNISSNKKTAEIDYYSSSDNKKVHGDGNNVGFYPFDYAQAGEGKGSMAKDLGFGMKIEIPFTLEKNGQFSDGTHQKFDFSGDDDLWVFVDGKLVLDLGGAHARTEGSIDFADKKVSVDNAQLTDNSSATRNTSFTFDNSNPNTVHTMTLYYMERGMYDSNLRFGFSFHAIPNQLKTEKKVRTANINAGFYKLNATTESGVYVDNGEREVTKFEATYQNEDFVITHEYHESGASDFVKAAGKKYTIGSSATQTVGNDGTYKLKNDEIAYFLGEFKKGDTIRLKESADSTNLYNYDMSVAAYDDANNGATVTGIGNAATGYSFVFTPTSTATTTIDNINLRARFTNQMKSHNLTLTKNVVGESDDTQFTFRIKFKFGDYDYTAYPLNCYVETPGTSTKMNTALTDAGEITITNGQKITFEKIPENAIIQIEEVDIATSYNFNGVDLTGATGTNINNGVQFTMGSTDIDAVVNNSKFTGFTIAKEIKYSPSNGVFVDYADNTSSFRIKVESSTDGSTWTALANKTFVSTDSSRTGTGLQTDSNGITTIKRGEKLSFSEIPANTYIRVTEDTQVSTNSGFNDHMPLDYQYRGTVAVQGSSNPTEYHNDVVVDNYFKGCSFQLTAGRVDVTITNMKPRYRWVARFEYNSRSTELGKNKLWGDLTYQSKGVFTADELLKYTSVASVIYTDSKTRVGIVFKSPTEKAQFLAKKSPHVDNFRETLSWNYNTANIDNIYSNTDGNELSLNVSKIASDPQKIRAVFYLPNQMKWQNNLTELVVDDADGKMHEAGVPNANIGADGLPGDGVFKYSLDKGNTLSYADWYTTNNVSRKQGSANAKFVTAPTKVWDVATNSYKYFQYWSVRTITNDSSDSVEYAKCYYKEFNYVFYQDSYVYAVYGDNNQNMYDIARQVDNSANLTFLENSRNQWNIYSSEAEASYIAGSTNYADRIFSDFVIDFHYSKEYLEQEAKDGQPAVYSRKNILLNEIPDAEKDNYKAGVLIETVRALDSTEVDTVNGKMLKTDKEISEQYSASNNINAKKDAIDYLYSTLIGNEDQDKNKYLTSQLSVKSFDNKNEMEYAYSFANIKQTVEANTISYTGYRKETDRKMKLYRAYSYLIDNSNPTNPVKIISDPVYFTIYDMASIINDYDIEVTKK